MKKIYLAALTLAMTACVSNEDLNPVDNYGYIDVNVSNDPVMVTRAEQTVSDLAGWIIKAIDNDNEKEYDLTKSKVVPAGNYKIQVSSHSNIETANDAGENNLGEPFYKCETTENGMTVDNETVNKHIEVSAGNTASATINCGKAQNARIKLDDQLNTGLTNELFSEVSLVTETTNERVSVTLSDKGMAYYSPNTTVRYKINYSYKKDAVKTTMTLENLSITVGSQATEKIITLKSNNSGQITVSINIDNEFVTTTEDITFDAATGEKVETTSEGN